MEAPHWYHQLLILCMSCQRVIYEMSPPSWRSLFINHTTMVPSWCHQSPTLAEAVGDQRRVLASKGDLRRIKVHHGTTDLPLMASCAKQLTIGSPLMENCWRSARRPAGDNVTITAAIYTSCSLLIFSTDCHDATKKQQEEGR